MQLPGSHITLFYWSKLQLSTYSLDQCFSPANQVEIQISVTRQRERRDTFFSVVKEDCLCVISSSEKPSL